jgi:hypothetical protein
LELGSERNGNANSGFHGNDLFAFALPTPHFATAFEEVPNLLDRSVRDRNRCHPWWQFEVSHPAAG